MTQRKVYSDRLNDEILIYKGFVLGCHHYNFFSQEHIKDKQRYKKSKKIFSKLHANDFGFFDDKKYSFTLSKDASVKGRKSLAAILSAIYPSLIVISDRIDGDDNKAKLWICVVFNHSVIGDGSSLYIDANHSDLIFSGDNISCDYSEDELVRITKYYQYHSNYRYQQKAKVIIDIQSDRFKHLCSYRTSDETLDDLISEAQAVKKSIAHKCRLKKVVPNQARNYLIVGAVVLVLLVLGIGALQAYQSKQKQEALSLKQQALLNEEARLLEARGKENFIDQLRSLNAYAVLNDIFKALPNLTYLSHGWQINHLSFTDDKATQLDLFYLRKPYTGADTAFILGDEVHAKAVRLGAGFNDTQLVIQFNRNGLADVVGQENILTDELLNNAKERVGRLYELVAHLQLKNIKHSYSPIDNKPLATWVRNIKHLNLYSIIVTGDSASDLLQLMAGLYRTPYVITENVKIQFNKERMNEIHQFTFRGIIYA
ncbi:hypothetical protein [Cysteiniphilum marinum]|uniref:hypothetical protein n=1 Tax=Cysteiniphilum marinum TaxID=2774191 RepID=UPI00193C3564|nr:hypothetical protein [Cysteiniphilum marinum]